MAGKPRKQIRIAESKVAYRAGRKGGARALSKEPPFPLEDWEWIQKHHARLSEEYAGRWIAVAQREVVGEGVRLATALRRAKVRGYEHPLVMAFRPASLKDTVEVAHWL